MVLKQLIWILLPSLYLILPGNWCLGRLQSIPNSKKHKKSNLTGQTTDPAVLSSSMSNNLIELNVVKRDRRTTEELLDEIKKRKTAWKQRFCRHFSVWSVFVILFRLLIQRWMRYYRSSINGMTTQACCQRFDQLYRLGYSSITRQVLLSWFICIRIKFASFYSKKLSWSVLKA